VHHLLESAVLPTTAWERETVTPLRPLPTSEDKLQCLSDSWAGWRGLAAVFQAISRDLALHTPLWEGELQLLASLLSAWAPSLSLGVAAGGSQDAGQAHLE